MQITNVHNLPETILRANKKRNEMYNANADISVTTLISPPQINVLRKAHFREMEKDVSEELFALLGSAVHQVLEWGADKGTVEERLYAHVNGWTVSGQIDLQHSDDGVHINDYKVTAAYSVMGEAKWEWEAQLNLYDYLLYLNKGYSAASLSIVSFIRDWTKREAQGNPQYPQAAIIKVPIRQWTLEEQEKYLVDRVQSHQDGVFAFDMGLQLPECSHQERWAKPDKWAVTKKGQKRAKLFSDQAEAQAYAAEHSGTIEYRPGDSIRCGYCGVSRWCAQQNALKVNKDDVGDGERDTPPVLRGTVDDPEDIQGGELPDQVADISPQDTEERDVEGAGPIFNPFV